MYHMKSKFKILKLTRSVKFSTAIFKINKYRNGKYLN